MDILEFLYEYSELGLIICYNLGLLIIILLLIGMREDQKLIKTTLMTIVAFITTGRQVESKTKGNKVEVLPKKKRGRPRKEK